MNILIESERFSADELARVEARYEAKYVCETCRKTGKGWQNSSITIFYQPDSLKVPEGASQWFGLFFLGARLMICNALSAVENDIQGIVANNGDVIYSRYRHDYRWSPDGSVMIDGGRDYTRTSTYPNGMVTLRIIEDRLTIVED